MHPIYEPDEDTFLLTDVLKNELDKLTTAPRYLITVLDLGTGSGYIGKFAKEQGCKVTFVDINEVAINKLKEEDLDAIHSDLFADLPKQSFDIIVFNTPYLPDEEDGEVKDIALHGGPRGNEVALEFLKQVKHYIHQQSIVLMLVSSLGHPEDIEEFLKSHSFSFSIAGRKKLFFEELLVYRIQRLSEGTNISQEDVAKLQKKIPSKYDDVHLLTKGKRGMIFTAIYDNQKVAIKMSLPSSDAKNTITIEASYLKKVNELGIGPKLIEATDEFVVMEFVEGALIGEFLLDATKERQEIIVEKVLKQLELLDQNNLNKFELTNPYKHIIIKKDFEPVLIDFERMRFAKRPKNVAQFKEYIKKFGEN